MGYILYLSLCALNGMLCALFIHPYIHSLISSIICWAALTLVYINLKLFEEE